MTEDFSDDVDEETDPADEDPQEPDTGGDPLFTMYAAYQAEVAERSRKYGAYIATSAYEADLRRAFESLGNTEEFSVGDIVQWKTFMRESQYPEYGAPAVVLDVSGEYELTKRAQQSFPRHDVLLAVLDGDQDFVTFTASSARLTRWQGDSA